MGKESMNAKEDSLYGGMNGRTSIRRGLLLSHPFFILFFLALPRSERFNHQ